MSYRKLEVEGQVFEYSIGKTHTKIRGVGAYLNTNVGSIAQSKCSCGSSGCFEDTYDVIRVRPSDLASFIKQNKLKVKEKR
jgi:hypothetical protein